jgi:hypothetical protein
MPTTQIKLETAADGSGIEVDSQTLRVGDTVTAYVIGRDANDAFVANVAANSIALQSVVGGVVAGDLTNAVDMKSTVFTGAFNGSCKIHAVYGAYTADSGTLTVLATAIVTLSQVKEYLGETGTTNDTLLTNWITRVTSILEAMLDQPVYSRVVTDYLDGQQSSNLYLKSGRIRSLYGSSEVLRLGSLQSRDTATATPADLVTDEDYIYLNERNDWCIELLDGNYFPYGQKNIRVKYYAGAGEKMLAEIQQVALEMIQMMWNESKQGGDMLGKISKNMSQTGLSTNISLKDLTPEWQIIIDRWRRLPYE